jgi:hypothetical protein
MAIHEFANPIPVVVEENKSGYAIYVRDGATWENDCWCIALCDGGHVKHYLSSQIKIYQNLTYGIKK